MALHSANWGRARALAVDGAPSRPAVSHRRASATRCAVRAIRAAFTWLALVCYLAGKPWRVVNDPATVKRACKLQVERAFAIDLWTRMRRTLADRATLTGAAGARCCWSWGDGGLLIVEAAAVERPALAWLPADDEAPASWLLEVIGKGIKRRFVPVSDECAEALRAHWLDRGKDFNAADAERSLVAPRVVPPTPRVCVKFNAEENDDATCVTAHRTSFARPSPRKCWRAEPRSRSCSLYSTTHRSVRRSIYLSPGKSRLRREAATYHARFTQSGHG